MSRFVETLRLKELAEEDIYFARCDQELIQALHERNLAEAVAADTRKARKLARSFEKEYRKVNRACKKEPLKLMWAIRRLIDSIQEVFHLVTKTPE